MDKNIFVPRMLKILSFMVLLFTGLSGFGQDSIPVLQSDSVPVAADSQLLNKPVADTPRFTPRDRFAGFVNAAPPSPRFLERKHPLYRFTDPMRYTVTVHKWKGKEAIFYGLLGLLLLFAILRNSFHRYVQDLFKTYFRTTVKQRQNKDQLLQSPLPSLLFNLFFAISIGMFIALVLQYFGLGRELNFWMLYVYCIAGLAAVYGVKFITLKLLGWLFQIPEATDSYIFVVFTTNKIIGMMLIPFVVVLAFTIGPVQQVAISLSMVLIVGILVYRFFLSYTSIRGRVTISFFHFLLYLLAFEIAPLILINKLLLRFLGETP